MDGDTYIGRLLLAVHVEKARDAEVAAMLVLGTRFCCLFISI